MARVLEGSAVPLTAVHDLFMCDLDGVVKVGRTAVAGASEHISAVSRSGGQVAYVTNNASRGAAEVARELRSFGLAASTADVVTSAQAAAAVVLRRFGPQAPVLLLGAEGLRVAVQEAGLREVQEPSEAVALMSGYAPEARWSDIMRAAVLVRDGLPYVASNTDSTIPTPMGVAPGHGTLVRLIADFAGVEPVVAGKPSPPLLQETIARTGASSALMVGDRLDTDIVGAHVVGVPSLLVMTGVTHLADLVNAEGGERPTHVAADLRGLHEVHPTVSVDHAGHARVNGWESRVESGRLHVAGHGDEGDWLRAAAAAGWSWRDERGTGVDVTSVRVPPGFLTQVGR